MEDVLICKNKEYCEMFYNGSTIIIDFFNYPKVKEMTDEEIVKFYEGGLKKGGE